MEAWRLQEEYLETQVLMDVGESGKKKKLPDKDQQRECCNSAFFVKKNKTKQPKT